MEQRLLEEQMLRRQEDAAAEQAAERAAEQRWLEEKEREKAVANVNSVVADIEEELLKPDPQPSAAQVAFVTEVGKKYVSPRCSSAGSPAWWGGQAGAADFASGGTCQECDTNNVASRNHGLQCSNRGHWVCWACMIKGIDWKKALADDPELFVQQEKEIINDNLEIDATGWRAGSGKMC